MGTLKIVNALGVKMELVQGSPYQFNSKTIESGSSIEAEVSTEFERFTLVLEDPDGQKYKYDLNKDHWYGGDGMYHYPSPESKINIILRGLRERENSIYIETNFSYAPEGKTNLCNYSSDSKALARE